MRTILTVALLILGFGCWAIALQATTGPVPSITEAGIMAAVNWAASWIVPATIGGIFVVAGIRLGDREPAGV